MSGNDPRTIIRTEPMGQFQIVAVLICIALNALDGFDVLAVSFAAPGISREWALGPGALGIVISTGLVGMAVGSLVLAPMADMVGRRLAILGCLVGMASGMLLSATVGDVYMLALWRVVTGLGIGGMLAAINAMAAEYANDRNRAFAVSVMTIGYPIGGVLGGKVAAILLGHYDWRAVFIFGGIVTAALLPIVALRLPESIEFLALKRPVGALARINAILTRMGHRAVSALPAPMAHEQGSVLDIFSPRLLPRTLSVAGAYFLHILTFYYILGWVPKIVTSLGFTAQQGTEVSVWTNLGGIIGGTLFGWMTHRFGLKPLAILAMLATAAALVLFGRTAPDLFMLKAMATLLGFFLFAGVVGLYSVLAKVYPTRLRATGTGFSIGVGRVGGVLGPAIGGWLIATGFSRPDAAALMAAGSVLAAVVLLLLNARHLRDGNASES
jgi:benzoate transport